MPHLRIAAARLQQLSNFFLGKSPHNGGLPTLPLREFLLVSPTPIQNRVVQTDVQVGMERQAVPHLQGVQFPPLVAKGLR